MGRASAGLWSLGQRHLLRELLGFWDCDARSGLLSQQLAQAVAVGIAPLLQQFTRALFLGSCRLTCSRCDFLDCTLGSLPLNALRSCSRRARSKHGRPISCVRAAAEVAARLRPPSECLAFAQPPSSQQAWLPNLLRSCSRRARSPPSTSLRIPCVRAAPELAANMAALAFVQPPSSQPAVDLPLNALFA